jgi:hypothetical protein
MVMAADGETREARGDGVPGSDSDGYQPDSAADNAADSGTDSDGYPPATAPDEKLEGFDEGMRPLIEQWKSMREGWWNKAGYETYWDLVQEEEAGWKRMGFRSIFDTRKKRPASASELPDASPPEIDLDAVAKDATRPRRPRDHQVNVRLTELAVLADQRAGDR